MTTKVLQAPTLALNVLQIKIDRGLSHHRPHASPPHRPRTRPRYHVPLIIRRHCYPAPLTAPRLLRPCLWRPLRPGSIPR
jgi:antibiotic biosynthesis monooxygenase (ABM) superfamily enzyme